MKKLLCKPVMFSWPSKFFGPREFLVISYVYYTRYCTIEYNICCSLQGVIATCLQSSASPACVCVDGAIQSGDLLL